MEKYEEYTIKLVAAVLQVFNEEDENFIDINEMNRENANAFFHALATVMPSVIYQHLTKTNLSVLDFNHLANRLLFQFSKLKQENG